MDAPSRTYEIHEVARLTGLAPARLRVWERRYEVVRPQRQANGYRAYTAEQVALLRAFARRVAAGERIGDLARRPRDQILAEEQARTESPGSPQAALLEAIGRLDRDGLEALVAQQLALRGLRGFAERVVVPLAQDVGDLWALGRIPVAAEHLASEVLVQTLKGGLRSARGAGPTVVGACLPGERHEWGILATFARIQDQGWRIHYLGPDLPLDDIVDAAWKLEPRAIALSIHSPERLDQLLRTLGSIPGRLPPGTRAIIGGAGAEARRAQLEGLGFLVGMEGFGQAA